MGSINSLCYIFEFKTKRRLNVNPRLKFIKCKVTNKIWITISFRCELFKDSSIYGYSYSEKNITSGRTFCFTLWQLLPYFNLQNVKTESIVRKFKIEFNLWSKINLWSFSCICNLLCWAFACAVFGCARTQCFSFAFFHNFLCLFQK